MQLLTNEDSLDTSKAYHRSYLCSSIKCCTKRSSYIDTSIPGNDVQDYDNVNPLIWRYLRAISGDGYYGKHADTLVKEETEM